MKNYKISKTKDNFIIVGIGEILWDLLPDGKRLGGAPANFAYHVNFLGAKGYVVTSVGKDVLGYNILKKLDNLKLNKDYIYINDYYPTGTVIVEIDKDGIPNYVIKENVAWDFIPSTKKLFDFASKLDAVCFGSLCQRSQVSRNTIIKFLNSTKKNCLRIFDINIRQNYYSKDIIQLMLNYANVFKLNDQELKLIANLLGISGTEEHVLKKILNKYDLNLIALTKGDKGSVLFSNKRQSYLDAKKINIVDTVGAGDAFTAAITVGLLKKQPLRLIHKNANHLASYICSQKGATPKFLI